MNLPPLPKATFWGSSGHFCGTKAHADSVCESPSGPVPVLTEDQTRVYGEECYRAATDRAAQIAQRWTHPDTLRLHAGEMTAQELRTVVAVLNGVIAEINKDAR